MWQYTDKGTLAGVSEKVDLNILNGNKTLNWFIKDENTSQQTINRTLRKGDKGEDVKLLQTWLNKLGYDCGKADGIFGTKTLLAVKKFQKDHYLAIDGIIGKISLKQILAEIDAK